MPILQFSSKSHYGLQFIIHLASLKKGTTATLAEVAKKEHISRAYLEEIAALLKKSGIVGSRKGIGGGFYLRRDPRVLSAGAVIAALEGPIVDLACTTKKSVCAVEGGCLSKIFWRKIKRDIELSLNRVMVGSMVSRPKNKHQ
jgi:Rrf2 family protein